MWSFNTYGATVSQELRDYYKRAYNFDDVDFLLPGGIEFGKIILTRSELTQTIPINEMLWKKGFDGIDAIMKWADNKWPDIEALLNV